MKKKIFIISELIAIFIMICMLFNAIIEGNKYQIILNCWGLYIIFDILGKTII